MVIPAMPPSTMICIADIRVGLLSYGRFGEPVVR
jgi:hypothetical protein